MLKKIILPVVLLMFTQQQIYGMKGVNPKQKDPTEDITQQFEFWRAVDSYMSKDKLPYLWMFLDNVPFQYGNSKIWKHGEAYYGLSNGIGFFPSFLNFGWLKVGIVDAHINLINTIIKYIKTYTAIKFDYYFEIEYKGETCKNPVWLNSLKWWLFYTVVTDIHLFSFKFFNCVKIKIISIGAVVTSKIKCSLLDPIKRCWYFFFDLSREDLKVPRNYFILSPRIEINITELINYFNGK